MSPDASAVAMVGLFAILARPIAGTLPSQGERGAAVSGCKPFCFRYDLNISIVSDFLYQHKATFDGATSDVEILDTCNCAVSLLKLNLNNKPRIIYSVESTYTYLFITIIYM